MSLCVFIRFDVNFACCSGLWTFVLTWLICDGIIGEAVEQEEKLCNKIETVREFTYLGDNVCACGGCEAAMTARRCGWVKFMECGELLYGWRFPLRLKRVV